MNYSEYKKRIKCELNIFKNLVELRKRNLKLKKIKYNCYNELVEKKAEEYSNIVKHSIKCRDNSYDFEYELDKIYVSQIKDLKVRNDEFINSKMGVLKPIKNKLISNFIFNIYLVIKKNIAKKIKKLIKPIIKIIKIINYKFKYYLKLIKIQYNVYRIKSLFKDGYINNKQAHNIYIALDMNKRLMKIK